MTVAWIRMAAVEGVKGDWSLDTYFAGRARKTCGGNHLWAEPWEDGRGRQVWGQELGCTRCVTSQKRGKRKNLQGRWHHIPFRGKGLQKSSRRVLTLKLLKAMGLDWDLPGRRVLPPSTGSLCLPPVLTAQCFHGRLLNGWSNVW